MTDASRRSALDHVGGRVPSLLDKAAGAVLGLLACLLTGANNCSATCFARAAATPASAAAVWPSRLKSSSVLIPKVYGPLSPTCRGEPGGVRERPGSVERMSGLPWKLVIFDNDGVMVDSEPLAEQAMSGALGGGRVPADARGVRGPPPGYDAGGHSPDHRGTKRAVAAGGLRGPLHLGVVRVDAARNSAPSPGSTWCWTVSTREGIAYCVASSGRRERVEFALSTVGLLSRLGGHWWGAEDVAHGKPAPDLFLLAAEQMATPPADCLVIEDAEFGVQAARAAGMAVFGFAARTPAEKLAGADYVFKDMAELPGLILGGAPSAGGRSRLGGGAPCVGAYLTGTAQGLLYQGRQVGSHQGR